MDNELYPEKPARSWETQKQIDRACDQFEAALKQGDSPRIADYVELAPPGETDELLGHLVMLDVVYRRRRGDSPSTDDYRVEFPERRTVIEKAFHQVDTDSLTAVRPMTDSSLSGGSNGNEIEISQNDGAASELREFGNYEILSKLGQGGMGVVYRARHRVLDRIVALKIIRRDRLEDVPAETRTEVLERFQIETKAVAQLEHDHIVRLYEAGDIDGCPYYSMQCIEGRDLSDVAGGKPIDCRQAAEYLEPIARAVHFAHTRDILHRDIKPRNVLIDSGNRPYIVDFGMAKWLTSDSQLTQLHRGFGTPSYMPPEQAENAASATCASDVYSLGATLYELVTGVAPFQADKLEVVIHRVLHERPTPPSELNPDVPAVLEAICLRCLEKEPADRYPSADELGNALSDFLHRHDSAKSHDGIRTVNRSRWSIIPHAGLTVGALVVPIVFCLISVFLFAPTRKSDPDLRVTENDDSPREPDQILGDRPERPISGNVSTAKRAAPIDPVATARQKMVHAQSIATDRRTPDRAPVIWNAAEKARIEAEATTSQMTDVFRVERFDLARILYEHAGWYVNEANEVEKDLQNVSDLLNRAAQLDAQIREGDPAFQKKLADRSVYNAWKLWRAKPPGAKLSTVGEELRKQRKVLADIQRTLARDCDRQSAQRRLGIIRKWMIGARTHLSHLHSELRGVVTAAGAVKVVPTLTVSEFYRQEAAATEARARAASARKTAPRADGPKQAEQLEREAALHFKKGETSYAEFGFEAARKDWQEAERLYDRAVMYREAIAKREQWNTALAKVPVDLLNDYGGPAWKAVNVLATKAGNTLDEDPKAAVVLFKQTIEGFPAVVRKAIVAKAEALVRTSEFAAALRFITESTDDRTPELAAALKPLFNQAAGKAPTWWLQEATASADRVKTPVEKAVTMVMIGRARMALGDQSGYEEAFTTARESAKRAEDAETVVRLLWMIADYQIRFNDRDGAVQTLQDCTGPARRLPPNVNANFNNSAEFRARIAGALMRLSMGDAALSSIAQKLRDEAIADTATKHDNLEFEYRRVAGTFLADDEVNRRVNYQPVRAAAIAAQKNDLDEWNKWRRNKFVHDYLTSGKGGSYGWEIRFYLASALVKGGHIDEALSVIFDYNETPPTKAELDKVVVVSELVRECCEQGHLKKARELFEKELRQTEIGAGIALGHLVGSELKAREHEVDWMVEYEKWSPGPTPDYHRACAIASIARMLAEP